MCRVMTLDELEPGDVLLYRATDTIWNPIAPVIRYLDGTEVSHAGLYLGEGVVAEALAVGKLRGLNSQPATDSVEGSDWIKVRRLKKTVDSFKPVLGVAEWYLAQDNRYAYEQAILLASILMTRKCPWDNGLLRSLAIAAFEKGVELIEGLLSEGKEPMICSEFVFSAYDEALPEKDDPYSLAICAQGNDAPRRWFSRLRRRRRHSEATLEPPAIHSESLMGRLLASDETVESVQKAGKSFATTSAGSGAFDALLGQFRDQVVGDQTDDKPRFGAPPEVTDDELDISFRRMAAALVDAHQQKTKSQDKLYGAPADAAPPTFADIAADFVTPGDLLKSPSLETVGKIVP